MTRCTISLILAYTLLKLVQDSLFGVSIIKLDAIESEDILWCRRIEKDN